MWAFWRFAETGTTGLANEPVSLLEEWQLQKWEKRKEKPQTLMLGENSLFLAITFSLSFPT